MRLCATPDYYIGTVQRWDVVGERGAAKVLNVGAKIFRDWRRKEREPDDELDTSSDNDSSLLPSAHNDVIFVPNTEK